MLPVGFLLIKVGQQSLRTLLFAMFHFGTGHGHNYCQSGKELVENRLSIDYFFYCIEQLKPNP